MKCILAITVSLLLGSSNVFAQEQDRSNELLGAIAGGVIGSTIGQGDGSKAATVIGAIVGYRLGDRIFGDGFANASYRDFSRECRRLVPERYRNNAGASRSWIDGCVNRLQQEQYELEQRAYYDALERN